MPDSPASESESDFVCDCEESFRSACAGEPFYSEHEGKRYCVLHFPGEKSAADFDIAGRRKIENEEFDFRGVYFPGSVSFLLLNFSATANFSYATFAAEADFGPCSFNAEADFSHAIFKADAHFGLVDFSETADFSHAKFDAKAGFGNMDFNARACFKKASFSALADFRKASFKAAAEFSEATFSEISAFSDATFSADADFGVATFGGRAVFTGASFGATAEFNRATFSADAEFDFAGFNAPANFACSTFSARAFFNLATFNEEAYFTYATFRAEANFSNVTFNAKALFKNATFSDYITFAGGEDVQVFSPASSLDLQFARIEKPDRLSFHTLSLHPHWFVNADPRAFDFINVHWNNSGKAKEELELLRSKDIGSPHRLLAIACRKLAANAEDNNRYREASHFRRMAFDAERLETWHGFDVRRLNWWYWIASGYGERPFQALLVLIGILVLFGLLYTQVGFSRWEPRLASEAEVATAKKDDIGAPLKFSRALTYSSLVMTLQKPEPRPATTAAQTVVLLETILGPVQAALLALAIRRKFMR